jgi:hypothetical protein
MVKVGSNCGVRDLIGSASSPLAMAAEEHRQRIGLNLPLSFFP